LTLIATAQSTISVDVNANGEEIRRLMREASGAAAQLIHFPEGALSGYVSMNRSNQLKGLLGNLIYGLFLAPTNRAR